MIAIELLNACDLKQCFRVIYEEEIFCLDIKLGAVIFEPCFGPSFIRKILHLALLYETAGLAVIFRDITVADHVENIVLEDRAVYIVAVAFNCIFLLQLVIRYKDRTSVGE